MWRPLRDRNMLHIMWLDNSLRRDTALTPWSILRKRPVNLKLSWQALIQISYFGTMNPQASCYLRRLGCLRLCRPHPFEAELALIGINMASHQYTMRQRRALQHRPPDGKTQVMNRSSIRSIAMEASEKPRSLHMLRGSKRIWADRSAISTLLDIPINYLQIKYDQFSHAWLLFSPYLIS